MMKKIKMKMLAVLTIIGLGLLVVSCEKENVLVDDNTSDQLAKSIVENAEIPLDNLGLLLEPEFTDPDVDADIEISNDGIPADSELESVDGKGIISPKLRFLFDKLDLSPEQVKKLHYSIVKYNKCRHHLFLQLKKLNHEIIAKANQKKHELIASYNAGKITEAQLKDALYKLKLHTKEVLKTNPIRKQIIVNLHKCHKDFVENVRLILTKEQWAKWVKWHKQGGKL
ncbi:MAG: hypothetical protein HOA61_06760 [Bacteroidetes bacterium]|jgi:hypothetical protein|nr:hypothetical protein [Bacteroidota bacterium]